MKWLTVPEAAKLLKRSIKTIYRWVDCGKLEHKRVRVGAGSETIYVKLDISKLDISKLDKKNVQLNTEETLIIDNDLTQMDTLKNECQNVHLNIEPIPAPDTDLAQMDTSTPTDIYTEVSGDESLSPFIRAQMDVLKTQKKSAVAWSNFFKYYESLSQGERAHYTADLIKNLNVSRTTFFNRLKKYRIKGEKGLTHKGRNDKYMVRIHICPNLKKLIEYALYESGEWNVSAVIRKIQDGINVGGYKEIFINSDFPKLPSDFSLRKWLSSTNIKDKWTYLWYNKRSRHLFQSVYHERGKRPPCTIWFVDDHDQDLLVWKDTAGGPQIRPKALRVIDPETNMLMGWHLTNTSYGAKEIKKALLHAFFRHRVIPNQIYLECDRRMREEGILIGLEDILDIKIYGNPYSPTDKANVEKSFNIDRLELDSTFDSYISNNPINRPDGAADRVNIDFAEYNASYERYCNEWNTLRKIKYKGKDMTPVEIWNAWSKGVYSKGKPWHPTTIAEQDLEHFPYWFSKVEERTIRGGQVQFTINGEAFRYADIPGENALMGFGNGRKVYIRRHFEDLKTGYVYEHPGKNARMIGKIQLIEGIGYGMNFEEDMPAIDYIRDIRVATRKGLKIDKDLQKEIQIHINRAESLIKADRSGRHENVIMPVNNKIIAFLKHSEGNPERIAMEQDDMLVNDILTNTQLNYEPSYIKSDEEIRDLLRKINKEAT